MADIDVKRTHNLGLKAARAAADKMAEHLGQRFGLQGEWNGDTLDFQRPGVSGSLWVDDKDLRLVVSLGFLLKAMKGSIEGAVRNELEKLFPEGGAPPARPSPKGEGEKARAKKGPARPRRGG